MSVGGGTTCFGTDDHPLVDACLSPQQPHQNRSRIKNQNRPVGVGSWNAISRPFFDVRVSVR